MYPWKLASKLDDTMLKCWIIWYRRQICKNYPHSVTSCWKQSRSLYNWSSSCSHQSIVRCITGVIGISLCGVHTIMSKQSYSTMINFCVDQFIQKCTYHNNALDTIRLDWKNMSNLCKRLAQVNYVLSEQQTHDTLCRPSLRHHSIVRVH